MIKQFLSEALGQAWDFVQVYNRDSTDSMVNVAGYNLMDYVDVTVDRTPINRTEQGIHKLYHAPVKIISTPTIRITVLPNGADDEFLRALLSISSLHKKPFSIDIKDNKRFVGSFICYFTDNVQDTIAETSPDTVFTFAGIEIGEGDFVAVEGMV